MHGSPIGSLVFDLADLSFEKASRSMDKDLALRLDLVIFGLAINS